MSKIYLNLEESEYKCEYCNIEFYFSSKFYLEKFKTGLQQFIDEETRKLKIRYKLDIDYSDILSLAYYRKIEKRGYKIKCRNPYIENIQIC